MDQMRIPGNEPSSVILSQTKWFQKMKKMIRRKCLNKVKSKGMVYYTHKITISSKFNTEDFDALKRYESTEVDRRTWLYVPSGTHWSTSSDTYQVVEIEKETSTKMYTLYVYILIYNIDQMRISGNEPSSVIPS